MYPRSMLIASGGVAALLLVLVGIPLYAAGQLSADFGKQVDFKPLVRHMVSQVHCYDIGTTDCETTAHFGTRFTKEYTMGFLLDGPRSKMDALGFKPVFVCDARGNSGVMMVTGGLRESDPRGACRAANFRPRQIGYIASSAQIEAPSPLYRCVHPTTHDTLLTNSSSECAAATYGPAQLLGYLYAGGPSAL